MPGKYEPFPKPAISADIAQEVGKLIAMFTWLEWSVMNLLNEVVQPKIPIEKLVGSMMFAGIVDTTISAVEEACRTRNPEFGEQIARELRAARNITHRNNVAHGFFYHGLLGTYSLYKRRGAVDEMPITAENIRQWYIEIEQIGDRINTLTAQYTDNVTAG